MLYYKFFQISLVAGGGAIGVSLRYFATEFSKKFYLGLFPLTTMMINILGSFLMGLLMGRYISSDSESARLFFITGLLGGFTTFSAFSWDTLAMLQRGAYAQAVLYVCGSVLLSLLAVMAGVALAK